MPKNLKYDYGQEMRMNTNNGMKWRRFIVPKRLNKLMTTKSNDIEIVVNDRPSYDGEW